MNPTDASLHELNRWMLAHHMRGYWMQEGGGPGVQSKPFIWKWADIYTGLLKAGELVPAGSPAIAEPRTLSLRNPGQGGVPSAVSLSPQILMPGEGTPARRALKNEARFVVQAPPGAVYVADGEPFPLEEGDLVVIPGGIDHHYDNRGTSPAIWLEASDEALLTFVGAPFHGDSPLDGKGQAVARPPGFFAATQDRMKAPVHEFALLRPPGRYPWTDSYATLVALAEDAASGDPYDGFLLRYTSPTDGGPTLPTFSCEIQLLTPGFQAPAHRHNSTAIYYVVRGEGRTEVAGEWPDWSRGDIFCVPPWTWHRHENPSSEAAILYSVDDWPAMAKMGFYRKEGGASE